jgi:DNA repair protein RecO (recombination protein O)
MEDAILAVDTASPAVAANFPIFFALHLSHFFGFRMSDPQELSSELLDLREGIFVDAPPSHPHWTGRETSLVISRFLKVIHPDDLEEIRLNRDGRRLILEACLQYYALHLTDFGTMRSLPVLQELMD